MTKNSRLLTSCFLSLLSGVSVAACSSSGVSAALGGASTTGAGGISTGGAIAGGGGPLAAGGLSAVGGAMATGTTGGSTSALGGATSATGGKSSATGGTTNTTGGIPSATGGTTNATGGRSSTSAGTTGALGGKSSASGGTSGAVGGTTNAAGGTLSSTGGTSNAAGGKSSTSGGTTGTTGGASNVKCTLPNLPDASSLTINKKLPDPFTFFDGTKVTKKDQWECRRQEILAMAAKYIYAPVPTKPDQVTGTVSGGTVSMTVKVGSKSDTFSATISGTGTAIALELSGGIFPSSHKKLAFGSGFEGKIKSLYGFASDVNPNIADGWMIDRVMDVLEQNQSSGHDPSKIMVSGCSGCGKGAYLAGVFSRAPLVVIVESGGGGAANLRQAEWFRHGDGKSVWKCADDLPQSIDNLESNGICGPWITSAANWLVSAPSKVNNLPFDTHLLLATIAPRYLLHFSNNNGVNSWCHLGGTCEALSAWAAKPVWKALGVPERMGFHMYSAMHCGNPAEATALAGEFFKRAIDGNTSAKTDVMDIMANGVQQPVSDWKGMWVDWDMETVLN